MRTHTSTSYVCTLDINSCTDMQMLETIKMTIKTVNMDPSLKYKKRVVVRGRNPKVKHSISNRWTGKISNVSYDFGGNIVGGIANATKLDVYIYDRRD